MNAYFVKSAIGLCVVSGALSAAHTRTQKPVDTSLEKIFAAVLDSRNMQATVNTLTVHGQNRK